MARQVAKITGQKPLPILLGWFEAVHAKKIAADSAVGPTAKGHVMVHVAHAEFRDQRGFHGRFAGTAARQERPVNIEEANLHRGIIASEARFLGQSRVTGST